MPAFFLETKVSKKRKYFNIRLTGEVDDSMFDKLLAGIGKSPDDTTSLVVHLNTHGGDVYSALAIYDLLKYTDLEVQIVTHGACMSAGILILMAGDVRASMPNCQFMVHYGSEFIESETAAAHSRMLTKKFKDMIKESTGLSTRKVNTLMKGESYFDAKKALEDGFIHGIKE